MPYKEEDLMDVIMTEATIVCHNCSKTDNIWNVDDYGASQYFFSQGWRVTKSQNVYCPECAKKKLKSK